MALVYHSDYLKARKLARDLEEILRTVPSHPQYETRENPCLNPICDAALDLAFALRAFLKTRGGKGRTFGGRSR